MECKTPISKFSRTIKSSEDMAYAKHLEGKKVETKISEDSVDMIYPRTHIKFDVISRYNQDGKTSKTTYENIEVLECDETMPQVVEEAMNHFTMLNGGKKITLEDEPSLKDVIGTFHFAMARKIYKVENRKYSINVRKMRWNDDYIFAEHSQFCSIPHYHIQAHKDTLFIVDTYDLDGKSSWDSLHDYDNGYCRLATSKEILETLGEEYLNYPIYYLHNESSGYNLMFVHEKFTRLNNLEESGWEIKNVYEKYADYSKEDEERNLKFRKSGFTY